jgi:hypothetical protein
MVEFPRGIDALDEEKLLLNLDIPAELEEKYYYLKFVFYDDEDMANNDVYENREEDEAKYPLPINVEGNCQKISKVSIVAALESGGKAGEELEVKATITNIGEADTNYALSVEDYSEWADSAELEKESIELDSGESEEIIITLNVKEDVSGEKTFNIQTIAGTEITKQPVSVTIEEKTSFWPSITGKVITEDNRSLWIIAAVNIILILAIILVIIKLSKRNKN